MGQPSGNVWAAVIAACAGAAGAATPPRPPERCEGCMVVRATPRTVHELRVLLALSDDVWSHGAAVGRESDFLVREDAVLALREAGLETRVLIPDVQALIDAERTRLDAAGPPAPIGLRGQGWFADFKRDAAIDAFIDELAALRPDLATTFQVGLTIEGRPIRGLRITGPGEASGKTGVVVTAGQHAREWIAPMAGAYLADRLVRGYGTDERVRGVLDGAVVHIIPLVNRDGYIHSWTTQRLWRKNRRPNADGSFGVDLNRNWNFQWGSQGASALPSDATFRGTGPQSEPEVAALASFILSQPSTALHIDLHSYGQYVLQPWGHTWEASSSTATFDRLGQEIASAIRRTREARYESGSVRRLLYPASGSATDWAAGVAGLISFTLELRDTGSSGFILPPAEIAPTVEETFEGLLAAMTTVVESRVTVWFADGVPAVAPAGGEAKPLVWVQRGAQVASGEAPVVVWRDSPIGEWNRSRARGVDPASGLWELSIRAGADGSLTWWYLESGTIFADGSTGTTMYPAAGPLGPIATRAGTVRTIFADDFEADRGWQVGAPGDSATTGAWERGDPEGTTEQPEDDASPRPDSTRCFFTGFNPRDSASFGDVDSGTTTLTSPAFDLSADPEARVTYARWYSVGGGTGPAADDALIVQVSTGGGAWVTAETVAPDSADAAGGWRRTSWRVTDFVTPGPNTRVRFVAADAGNPGLVEAAIDEFRVSTEIPGLPGCVADINGDGAVSTQDLYDFLTAFAAGRADLDGAGGTTVQDLYDFLGVWLAGCE